jgi:rhamnosyltransferase
VQNVFIIGSKGIPSAYGGFESFVDRLTFFRKSNDINYHVACAVEPEEWTAQTEKEFSYNNARCFRIKWKKLGAARAIFYDVDALKECIDYIKANKIEQSIVYVLACRIGPFFNHYVKKIHKLGGKVYVNPDGHEWKRAKWSAPVRAYWKISERLMVKHADLLICDSKAIEKYIHEDYQKYSPKTTFIAYGSDTVKSKLSEDAKELNDWYQEKGVKAHEYYLAVGRFVPENNFETMVSEFMKSNTKKDFVLITNVENNSFYESLLKSTHFDQDKRIKFVGTVYDKELLKKLRENAYGYFHGHEVGGTNPSLLESLGSTDLNLLLDVGFNREVGEDGALYWSKEDGALASLIHKADAMTAEEISAMGIKAKERITKEYSWDYIVDCYEKVFLGK